MLNRLQHIALTTATLSLSFATIHSVQAATFTYDFSGTTDSGPLVGETYSGFLSFDDSNVTGNGSEFLTLSNLNIDFPNPIFSNATPVSDAEAAFFNGTFLGLSFSTDVYSFIPGFFNINEASFAYEVNQQDGAGNVNYTLRNPAASVPEPGVTFGLFLIAFLFTQSNFLRHKASNSSCIDARAIGKLENETALP
jgi:hypothetical protein